MQKVLKDQEISPVVALGENVMAYYENEKLIEVVSALESPVACQITPESSTPLPIKKLAKNLSPKTNYPIQ